MTFTAAAPRRFVSLLYHDVYPDPAFDYGRIGASATRYHVALSSFVRHLDLVQAAPLHQVTPASLAALFREGGGTAGRGDGDATGEGVLVCFDDGWEGALTHAADALARRKIPAYFFVTTGLLGKRLFATKELVQRLDGTLFAVGSHGASHRMLSSLGTGEVRAELRDSKRELEDIIGRAVTALSAPGGAVDRRVREIAREEGYTALFTSTIAINPTRRGAFDVARLGVTRLTSDDTLARWLTFRLRRERLRKTLLGIPKRLLGMRAYSRVRRVLLGEALGHEHVFEP